MKDNYDPREVLRRDRGLLVIIIAALVVGIILYPSLPDQIPGHWNIRGEVDRYNSKEFGVFFFPLLALAIYFAMAYLPLVDPRRENYARFTGPYRLIRWAVLLFLVGIYLISLYAGLGKGVDVGAVVRIGLGLLFVVIGNVMGKLQHNYFVGIKTPWALADPRVWRETHRRAGWVWVAGGLLTLVSAFIPGPSAFIFLMVVLAVVTVYSVVVAYFIYRQYHGK